MSTEVSLFLVCIAVTCITGHNEITLSMQPLSWRASFQYRHQSFGEASFLRDVAGCYQGSHYCGHLKSLISHKSVACMCL